MIIYPAIDLYNGNAVRLLKGDYNAMTVYSEDPVEVARDFRRAGATHIHLVDLEGAKDGTTPNLATVKRIIEEVGLFAEIGGGIRSMDTIDTYLAAGAERVILGTAAIQNPTLLREACARYRDKIAVGVDIKDGMVAIHGWTETTTRDAFDFCRELQEAGVTTIICTDISRDGAMQGTNHDLYRTLAGTFSMNIIASGGVTDIGDIERLAALGIHGAIIGRAYYTGAIRLSEAIEVAK